LEIRVNVDVEVGNIAQEIDNDAATILILQNCVGNGI
jgi:hypothetical protein